MEYLIPLAGLALAHLIAAASPGPAFIVALQGAVARDRRAYSGAKLWIDRVAGGRLAALGLKLALSER